MDSHRPGKYKQANKKHNPGKHKSKGLIKKVHNGRVGKPISSKKLRKLQSRQKIIQSKAAATKKEKLIQIPLICFIMIDELSSPDKIEFCLTKNYDIKSELIQEKYYKIKIPAPLRNNYKVYICNMKDLRQIMQIITVANLVFFVSSVSNKFKITYFAENLLSIIINSCNCNISHVYQNPFGLTHKNIMAFKNSYERTVRRWVSNFEKFHSVDTPEDLSKLFMLVSRQVINVSNNNKNDCKRSFFLLESFDSASNLFKASIFKYSCNPLNNIFFQDQPNVVIKKIELINEGNEINNKISSDIIMDANIVLYNSDNKSFNNSLIKMVGSINDTVDTDNINDKNESDYRMDIENSQQLEIKREFIDDGENTFEKDFDQMSDDLRFRDDWNHEEDDLTFNKLDYRKCPSDIPARERFLKYRGLENFNHSSWEGSDILPDYYSNLYQFKKNYKSIKLTLDKVLEEKLDGEYIEIGHSYGVSLDHHNPLLTFPSLSPMIYDYENQLSQCNLIMKRVDGCYLEIKSKTELLFCIGNRFFYSNTIFSEYNAKKNFKNKFERYMPLDGQFFASLIAPINLIDEPVTVFKKDPKTCKSILIATGKIFDYDVNKLIIKRTILTGRIYKTHKNLVVVSHMFNYKSDVDWFKPVELSSTNGKRGYIKHSLGTHGLFKSIFDSPLESSEKIYLNLYKRMFPKFSFKWMDPTEIIGL